MEKAPLFLNGMDDVMQEEFMRFIVEATILRSSVPEMLDSIS